MDWEIIDDIPLSTTPLEDYWVWHYEKSGIFSARSDVSTETGDNCCLGGDRTGRSDTGAQEKEWCELWRIKVPSNMCIPVPIGEALHRNGRRSTLQEHGAGQGCVPCVVKLTLGGMLFWSAT